MATPEAYSVSLSSRARRETRNLDRQTLTRVAKAIDGLAQNPRPTGCLKVKTAEGLWRIRVGDWRVIYAIDDGKRIVDIVYIRHRSKAYE